MAGKSLQLAKAPKDWKPSRDQLTQIQSDPRLQRLDRDSLYFYLNKPKGPATPAQKGVPAQPAPPPQNNGLNFIQTIINALSGG